MDSQSHPGQGRSWKELLTFDLAAIKARFLESFTSTQVEVLWSALIYHIP